MSKRFSRYIVVLEREPASLGTLRSNDANGNENVKTHPYDLVLSIRKLTLSL